MKGLSSSRESRQSPVARKRFSAFRAATHISGDEFLITSFQWVLWGNLLAGQHEQFLRACILKPLQELVNINILGDITVVFCVKASEIACFCHIFFFSQNEITDCWRRLFTEKFHTENRLFKPQLFNGLKTYSSPQSFWRLCFLNLRQGGLPLDLSGEP